MGIEITTRQNEIGEPGEHDTIVIDGWICIRALDDGGFYAYELEKLNDHETIDTPLESMKYRETNEYKIIKAAIFRWVDNHVCAGLDSLHADPQVGRWPATRPKEKQG